PVGGDGADGAAQGRQAADRKKVTHGGEALRVVLAGEPGCTSTARSSPPVWLVGDRHAPCARAAPWCRGEPSRPLSGTDHPVRREPVGATPSGQPVSPSSSKER